MAIKEKIEYIQNQLRNTPTKLIAVSKTHPPELIKEAYDAGQRLFGENKVQELMGKYEHLPQDVEWHLIGHLQRNKVKYIAPFISMIQSVDSLKLLKEINKQAEKNNRKINCLLQIYIADEETKFGLSCEEAVELVQSLKEEPLPHVQLCGVMGIATNTENEDQLRTEFQSLRHCFEQLKAIYSGDSFTEISMGMSSDWEMAIEEGSTFIRVGSAIFGNRNYS